MEFMEEIKNIDASEKKVKNFGRLFAFIGIASGILLFIFSSGKLPFIFLITGFLFLLSTFMDLRILKPLFYFWMTLAFILGFIVSNVILVVFFYLVLKPISLTGRIFGKNFLDVAWGENKESYWVRKDKKHSREIYEKQF